MKLKATESELIRAIYEYLKYKGHLVVRVYAGGLRKDDGSYRPQPYLQKGTSDLLVCVKPSGRFLSLEVKSKDGQVSEHQDAFLESVIRAGGEGAVVRSINDVECVIEKIQGGIYD